MLYSLKDLLKKKMGGVEKHLRGVEKHLGGVEKHLGGVEKHLVGKNFSSWKIGESSQSQLPARPIQKRPFLLFMVHAQE